MIFLAACGIAFCLGVGYALGRTFVLGIAEYWLDRKVQRTNANTLAKIQEAKNLMRKDDPDYQGGGYA